MLIRGDPTAIARVFGLIVDLQPVAWVEAGLVCAPLLSERGDVAARCPLPIEPTAVRLGHWPDTVARWVSGWYLRSAHHAPAPASVREIVQADGEGFGPLGHPTTAMCLRAMEGLPAVAAVDVGCGSGILSQAWVRSTGCPVVGVDIDPRAVAHARASADLAGLGSRVEFRHDGVHALGADDLAGRVVFANMPITAHHALAERLRPDTPPAALVASGIRPEAFDAIRSVYTTSTLRITGARRSGGFLCLRLEARR